jgi:hypothetical protein
MRRLVYAFYDQTFNFGDFLRQYPAMKGDVTDCLIGNLFKDFGPLFDAVSEFAQMPEPLSIGSPYQNPERQRRVIRASEGPVACAPGSD